MCDGRRDVKYGNYRVMGGFQRKEGQHISRLYLQFDTITLIPF